MKVLKVKRGGNKNGYKCVNGDVYDSTAELINDDGTVLWKYDYVNTDKTTGYDGGILAPGTYNAIVGYRWNAATQMWNGKRVIKLFKKSINLDTIRFHNFLTAEMVILPSLIPNPNHNGKYNISFVQVHDGGTNWDWSHGCITVLNNTGWFDRLMAQLTDNEKLIIELIEE